MAPPARLLFSFVFALSFGVSHSAHAVEPPRLSIATVGTCPSAEEVTQELRQLMPDATLEVSSDVVASDVIVSDRGAGFAIKVRGQRRRFRNVERDCLERARHVAVFTVLIVDPLRIPGQSVNDAEEEPEPAPPPPGPAPKPRAPAPPHEPGALLDLSLGPLAQVSLKGDTEGTAQAGGLGLRLRYGKSVGVTLGVAGLLPTSLHYPLADARATWMPLDLGLSLSRRVSNWEVGLDVGLAASLLLVRGEALDATQQATRLEVGGRIGAQVRFWATEHAGVWGGMFGSYFPEPYSLQVEGIGKVGQTPTAWIGGSLGAIIRL